MPASRAIVGMDGQARFALLSVVAEHDQHPAQPVSTDVAVTDEGHEERGLARDRSRRCALGLEEFDGPAGDEGGEVAGHLHQEVVIAAAPDRGEVVGEAGQLGEQAQGGADSSAARSPPPWCGVGGTIGVIGVLWHRAVVVMVGAGWKSKPPGLAASRAPAPAWLGVSRLAAGRGRWRPARR